VNGSAVRPSPVFFAIVAVAVLGGVLATFDSNTALNAGTFLLVIGGWAVSLCLHEFGHAFVAYRGGDYSVRQKGYLNLDIRKYTDPVFSIVLPLLLLAIGGIPLPGGAVWINHNALRSRRVESLVSLAGPLSNVVFALVLTLVLKFGNLPLNGLYFGLSLLALFQVLAFVLNILPVPGLDGWGAIEPWLSFSAKRFGAMVRPWAPFALFALLIGVPGVRTAFFDLADYVYRLIGGDPLAWPIGNYYFRFWQH
jgi:Zn-dependent protease